MVDVNEEFFCQARGVTPFQNPALAIKPTSDFLHHPIYSPTQFLNKVFSTTGVTFGQRDIFPWTLFFFLSFNIHLHRFLLFYFQAGMGLWVNCIKKKSLFFFKQKSRQIMVKYERIIKHKKFSWFLMRTGPRGDGGRIKWGCVVTGDAINRQINM